MDFAQTAFPGQMRGANRLPIIFLDITERRRDLRQQGGVRVDLPLGFRFLPLLNPEQFQNKRTDQVIDALPIIRPPVTELVQNPVCDPGQNAAGFRREKICALIDRRELLGLNPGIAREQIADQLGRELRKQRPPERTALP